MPKYKGFSIIELLIVVAIILIIAAISIPNMLRARMAANESSAAASLRTIASAEITYFTTYPNIGYSVNLADLGGAPPCVQSPVSACLLDTVLSAGIKSGYLFVETGIASGGPANTNYVTGAAPITPGATGNNGFCSTSEQVLRIQNGVAPPPVTTLAACYAYPIAP